MSDLGLGAGLAVPVFFGAFWPPASVSDCSLPPNRRGVLNSVALNNAAVWPPASGGPLLKHNRYQVLLRLQTCPTTG